MKHPFSFAAAAAVALAVALPAGAQALPPLSQVDYVNDRLMQARVADRIRRECPRIEARMVRAYGEAQALKSWAQRRGYTDAQIDAYLKSGPDRDRIYARAETYMAQQGAKPGDAASYCRLGRAEIAAGSLTGSLLRAR